MKNISLLQENRFGPRKRGSNTIPAKIFRRYGYTLINEPNEDKFINFYRMPSNKIFNSNLLFTYSKSKIELVKDNQFSEKLNFIYLKNKNKIYSNGFYYSKYFDMLYYPRYFFEITIDSQLSIVNYQSKFYKFGIYNRPECNDENILLKYIVENNIEKENVLIFGKSIAGFDNETNQNLFFKSIETYLINNVDYDCVSNTLLEALYLNKKILLMNPFSVANDNKAFLEVINYFGKDIFFQKLNKLNDYCWKNLNEDNFKKRSEKIQILFKKSKTFKDFLLNF
jgi:hypothetical protein